MDKDVINRLKINLDYLSEYLLNGIGNVIEIQQILLNLLIDDMKGKDDV